MKVTIELVHERILIPPHLPSDPETGATVDFSGTVRLLENGRRIHALRYEAYESMAVSEIQRIVKELVTTHPAQSVVIIHRLGWIPVGESAIFIRVESRHRSAALGLVTAFMDRLKLDVPIWKVESREE